MPKEEIILAAIDKLKTDEDTGGYIIHSEYHSIDEWKEVLSDMIDEYLKEYKK